MYVVDGEDEGMMGFWDCPYGTVGCVDEGSACLECVGDDDRVILDHKWNCAVDGFCYVCQSL